MSDGHEAPDTRPLMSKMRDLVRGEGARTEPSGRHAVRPMAVPNLSDLVLFASATDEVFQPPDDLDPWDPAEGEEIPWELREDESRRGWGARHLK
jgi:hypothetical protein